MQDKGLKMSKKYIDEIPLTVIGLNQEDEISTLFFQDKADGQKYSVRCEILTEGGYSINHHIPSYGKIDILELNKFPEMEYSFSQKLFEEEHEDEEDREVFLPKYENYDDFHVANNEVYSISYDGYDSDEPRASLYVEMDFFNKN